MKRSLLLGVMLLGVLAGLIAFVTSNRRPPSDAHRAPGTATTSPTAGSPALIVGDVTASPYLAEPVAPAPPASTGSDSAPAATPGAPIDPAQQAIWLADDSVSLQQRVARIQELAQRGDAPAVRALMAAGDAGSYLSPQAIEALANVRAPGVAEYLTGKLKSPDIRCAIAAIKALPAARGDEAIPDLARLLEENRRRVDGPEREAVGLLCANALALVASPRSLPVLERELHWVASQGKYLEYGSGLAKAVSAVGESHGTVGLEALHLLEAYADSLAAKMPDDPTGRKYCAYRVAEVRRMAARLKEKLASRK